MDPSVVGAFGINKLGNDQLSIYYVRGMVGETALENLRTAAMIAGKYENFTHLA